MFDNLSLPRVNIENSYIFCITIYNNICIVCNGQYLPFLFVRP